MLEGQHDAAPHAKAREDPKVLAQMERVAEQLAAEIVKEEFQI